MKLDMTCEGEVGWWTNQGKRGPAEGGQRNRNVRRAVY